LRRGSLTRCNPGPGPAGIEILHVREQSRSGLLDPPQGFVCQIVYFERLFLWPDKVGLRVGKFSRDNTTVFEQQFCNTPSSFHTEQTGSLEFKIVKNVVEADRGRYLSLPVFRFDWGIGLDLAAVYERGSDEPQSQAADFIIFQFEDLNCASDYGCNVTSSQSSQ
jgi:hypothetical protein